MRYIILFYLILFSLTVHAQEESTPVRKNIIKVDITSYWLYRNAVVFAYERITKPNQSFVLTAGYQQFPNLGTFGGDSIQFTRNSSASGFKLGAEYRFYLKKENKYNAPHGIYIGPYTTFHSYSNMRSLEVDYNGKIEETELHADLNIINIGVQLGYQFVLNNRWTIDLTFIGPSVSNYSLSARLDGNYTFDPEEIKNEVIQKMIDRFPAFEELIDTNEFNDKGKIKTWAYGYRYQFQIGYHFGRKHK